MGWGDGIWVGGVSRFSNIEHIRVRECVQCPLLANHRPRCLCVHQSEAATVMWIKHKVVTITPPPQLSSHTTQLLVFLNCVLNSPPWFLNFLQIVRSLHKMKGHSFNIDNGYLEGLCRGFKNGESEQLVIVEWKLWTYSCRDPKSEWLSQPSAVRNTWGS